MKKAFVCVMPCVVCLYNPRFRNNPPYALIPVSNLLNLIHSHSNNLFCPYSIVSHTSPTNLFHNVSEKKITLTLGNVDNGRRQTVAPPLDPDARSRRPI